MTETAISDDPVFVRLRADEAWTLLQLTTLLYYLHETNPDNLLVRDKTEPNAPVSIAAVGMALATLPVVVERGIIIREFAARDTLKRLRFLLQCPEGPEPGASGYKGFFYHFLDIETGRRVWQCELSTIDSAFLFAGVLTVASYFDRDTAHEVEIRSLANALYQRADWNWARDGGATLTHGWRPESGFIPHRWRGYDEGLLLYILGLGSPTHPLPRESYRAYCATYQWKSIYGRSYCQVLWIEGDQAAAFFRFFCDSICTPSSNETPARTSGTSSAASRRRQCPSATCSSLNAITSPAVREPAPFVTPSRSRTVANVDSIGFVVRKCFQCRPGSRSTRAAAPGRRSATRRPSGTWRRAPARSGRSRAGRRPGSRRT